MATNHPPPGYPYPRSQNSSASSDGQDAYLPPHPASGYPYVSDFSAGSMLQTNMNTLPAPSVAPLRMPPMVDAAGGSSGYHLPPSQQSHSQSPSYSSSPSSQNVHSMWDSGRSIGRADSARPASSWSLLPSLDTAVARPRSNDLNTMSSRSEAFSPQAPHRPWSSSASSTASSSSGGATGSHYTGSSFPTLTSPFYPAQSPTQRHADASSPSGPSNASQDYFPPGGQHARRLSSGQHGGPQMHSGITHPSANSSGYMTPSSGGSQWSSQYPRSSGDQQRPMPPIQPISTYPLQNSSAGATSPSASSSGAQSAHMAYWDRRYDGR